LAAQTDQADIKCHRRQPLGDGEFVGCRKGIKHRGQARIENTVQSKYVDLHGYASIDSGSQSTIANPKSMAISISKMAFVTMERRHRPGYIPRVVRVS